MHDSRFTKSSTKENDNMNDDLQHERVIHIMKLREMTFLWM